MKNLMINENFISSISLMSGEDSKKLLLWCYNYAVNHIAPTEEEVGETRMNVIQAYWKYKTYIDYCNVRYDNKVKETETINYSSDL